MNSDSGVFSIFAEVLALVRMDPSNQGGRLPKTSTLSMNEASPTNSEAFEIELFRDYLILMARSLLGPKFQVKLDASDLVQQTMLDAHQKREQFRGESQGQLAAWLKQILRNNFLNTVRELQRAKRDIGKERRLNWEQLAFDSFSRVDEWLFATDPSPSAQVATREQILQLPSALNQLPEEQREAIVMYHIQGWRLAEIAAKMERSESAVGGLVYRGLGGLRKIMRPS